ARDCKAAQVDRGTEPECRCKYNGGTLRGSRRRCAKKGKTEVERKRAPQKGTPERCPENDAPTPRCRRQTGADTHCNREQREIGGDGLLVSTDQRLDQWRQQ